MSESRAYSQLDIQRYLQQQMAPQEMHEFEKALMDDPFLADAIGGFSISNLQLANEHLHAIERELAGGNQKAKVIAMRTPAIAWRRVVAIVVVVVIGATLFYSLTRKPIKEKALARQESAGKPSVQQAADSIAPADKPLANNEITTPKVPQTEPKRFETPKPQALTKTPAATSVQDSNYLSSITAPVDKIGDNPSMALRKAPTAMKSEEATARTMMLSQIQQNVFKGQVTDQSGEPLPFATVKVPGSNVGTVADAEGKFILRSADSVLHAKVAAIGYDTLNTELKSQLAANNITLSEVGLSLGETVALGYARKENKKAVAQKNLPAAAEPEGGWLSFNQYVHRSIDSSKAADENTPADQEIELEFSIDKQGKPVDIKVQEEANKIVADKAKQILTKGPKWKNKQKDKKVKVTIPF